MERDPGQRAPVAGELGAAELEAVFGAIPALVFIIATDDTIVGYRAGSVPLYAPPESFVGRRVDEVLPPNVASALRVGMERARANGRATRVEYDLPGAEGTEHFEARLIPLGGGRVAALVMDATDRWQAERRLRESEEQLRVAFEMSPDAVSLNRVDSGAYVAVNEGFCRHTGWTEAEVVGRTSLDLGICEPAVVEAILANLREGRLLENHELKFRRRDGSRGDALVSGRVVSIGGTPCLLTVTRDVTDRKRAEEERAALAEQLREAQKMEAIGRLAGGVAHDFNNILTSVLSTAELMKRDLPQDHPCRADADQIQEDAERAAELTRQLLAFARRQMVAPRVVRVEERTLRLEKMLSRVLGENVALVTRFAADCWPVLVDPGQLEQVVVNLAVNARDAMPDGGRLVISAENATVPSGARVGSLAPGDYVVLAVTDSGRGMTKEVLARIFEPFYTTKGSRGVGLGLATCYGIVRQAGGDILAESTPGAGSRFRVYLPRAAAATAVDDEPAARDVGGTETVLLVEDDAHVRRVAVRALADLGYRVLEAGTAREAAERADAQAGPVDVVVMDAVLPDGNGRDAAEGLRMRRPGIAVLFVSGYAEDLLVHRGVPARGLRFLPKPYTPRGLAAAVRAALDAARAQTGAGAA